MNTLILICIRCTYQHQYLQILIHILYKYINDIHIHAPFVGQQPLHPYRAPSVDAAGRYSDLRPETESAHI